MERICPFLTIGDDGRSVADAYDRGHVCRAQAPARDPVDQDRQLAYCLGENHVSCERYAAALRRRGPVTWPAPAPDAIIPLTRLVVHPQASRRAVAVGAIGARGRRWAIGGAVATIGVAAVASGVAGSLGGLVASAPSAASASPTPIGSAAPTPTAETTASPVPTTTGTTPPTATVAPTPGPTPTRPPTATPAPQQQTYVVQPGDTLNGIAIRFGTSVQAIKDANGLGASDVILVGQVLIIP